MSCPFFKCEEGTETENLKERAEALTANDKAQRLLL